MTQPAARFAIEVHDQPPADATGVVDQGIGEHNDSAAPLHQVQPLASVARDAQGQVIGGAVGRTWGQCCELMQLWVQPEHRLHGLATELMRAFETRAAERGCRVFYLETWSFQALGFYQGLGYELRLAIEGFGPGLVKYSLVKGQPAP
jgi:GNAT superfamily N-acetyltransferase